MSYCVQENPALKMLNSLTKIHWRLLPIPKVSLTIKTIIPMFYGILWI
jgi:hypothetical protein